MGGLEKILISVVLPAPQLSSHLQPQHTLPVWKSKQRRKGCKGKGKHFVCFKTLNNFSWDNARISGGWTPVTELQKFRTTLRQLKFGGRNWLPQKSIFNLENTHLNGSLLKLGVLSLVNHKQLLLQCFESTGCCNWKQAPRSQNCDTKTAVLQKLGRDVKS